MFDRQWLTNRRNILKIGASTIGAVALPSMSGVATYRHTLSTRQGCNVGSLSVEQQNTALDLKVTYDTSKTDWLITETHLHVGDELEDIPTNPAGNPTPGQFNHGGTHENTLNEVSYRVDVSNMDDDVYIAAHAVVQKKTADKTHREEAAWAGEERFNQQGNWATYAQETRQVSVEVIADNLVFPEGPAFEPDGTLWFTELFATEDNLNKLSPDGELTSYTVDGHLNGLALDSEMRPWLADAQNNAIKRFNPDTGDVRSYPRSDRELVNTNDLAFDRDGDILFTSPIFSSDEPGYVNCLRLPDGTVERVATFENDTPNGILFRGDELLVTKYDNQEIIIGDWDGETWSNRRVFADVSETVESRDNIGPDGMALGEGGDVFVAMFGTGLIKAIRTDGEIDNYPLPGPEHTNLAFDPTNEKGLVVTQSHLADQGSGKVFSIPELGPGAPNSPYYGNW